ncbi:unnamed protein product [Rotaria sordida]|uniref:F-box domain-containing protein n=1 Tax=Rotaria sordida TaxID=392033 RepID=A0A814H0K7_9BILA|nr:unnamed protein product [Rotaria sordida]
MQQIKRERQDNDTDDDGAKKFKIESNSLSRQSITYFENLSNETILEIFELLDFDHLYEAFSNLNIRFQNLLADSHCSVSFSLSWMSKLNFQRYYTENIQPNQHRIKSLCLSNTFMINHILTPIYNASKLIRLQTLFMTNIFSKYLDEIFQSLSTLPVLSALIIVPVDYVKDKAKLYCQILRLSGLRYCRIQLSACNISKQLSITSISKWKFLCRAFQSSFYFDRQWFFDCQYRVNSNGNCIFFYSTNPYRRKKYALYTKIEKLSSTPRTPLIDSVTSVDASDGEAITHCSNYFLNAMELITSSFYSQYCRWNTLNRILPLQQLTQVIFDSSDCNLASLTELLNLTPNLDTLVITSSDILNAREKYVLFKKNKAFQLVSNANHIKTLIIHIYLTLEEVKLFTDLCPRVEHLTIWISQNYLQSVLQFLLSKNNTKPRYLNSLLIDRTSEIPNKIIETLIESENLQVDYTIGNDTDEHLRKIYLWL